MTTVTRTYRRLSRKAVTLLEVVAAITVLSIISAAVLPVISGAVDTNTQSITMRRQADSAAFALEKVTRLLRDVPKGAGASDVGISSASLSSVTFTDGRSLSLSGTNLMYNNGSTSAVLCRNVSTFEITYLGEDGVTSTLATPLLTRRFNVRLVVGNVEFRTSAFARVWMVK